MSHAPAWYDHQYNNRGRIPEHPAILQHWSDASAAARASLACALDLPYSKRGGADPAERLDIFLPSAAPAALAPILIYLHGGYWRALDKRDQSFVATPFVDAGAVVVLPNYSLCPAVGIQDVVLQIVQALAWVYRHAAAYGGDPRRLVVAGHSAGGQLAAMMLACRWPEVGSDLPADLVPAALSVSGVFDLAPLRHAPFLAADLQLTRSWAERLSPARLPAPQGRLWAFVGGEESEEFLRQNALIRQAWGERAVPVCETLPGRHHMNVLHDLADPRARLHLLARELLGL
jgi:arylformamidase